MSDADDLGALGPVEGHLFQLVIGEWLRKAVVTEFKPLDYALNHELPKITRVERNERAVAWWRQSTGRTELWRDPRHDAVPVERYSPLTSMAAWSATPGPPREEGPNGVPVADPRRD